MSAANDNRRLTVQVFTDSSRLSELQGDWNRIGCGLPFRTFDWHYHWWQHFGGDRSLLVLTVFDADVCIGIAPFFVERSLSVGRVVQFIGSGEVASDQQSILALAGRSREVGIAVADWFSAQYGGEGADPGDTNVGVDAGDLLELDGIDASCPTFQAFVEQLELLRFTIHDRSTVNTWRIALPASTDDYLAMLSKPCRRKVRTALKQFDASGLAVSIADDDATFAKNWSHFTQLHQRRRQSLGQPGCFANEAFSRFLHDVATRFQQAGLLDLVCISQGDEPIATEICFRDRCGSFAYQIGINPDALEHSPGWVVNAASIRRAIEMRLAHFDLCRGDAEYKRQLGAEPTVCKKLRIVPPRLRSQMLSAAMTTGAAMKHWCQNMLTGAPLPS